MNELEQIVQSMIDSDQPEENINAVIAEYNSQKEGKTNATAEGTANVVAENPLDTDLQSEIGSLEFQNNQSKIDSLKTNFDQGKFTSDQREVYENYKNTGEIKLPKTEKEEPGFADEIVNFFSNTVPKIYQDTIYLTSGLETEEAQEEILKLENREAKVMKQAVDEGWSEKVLNQQLNLFTDKNGKVIGDTKEEAIKHYQGIIKEEALDIAEATVKSLDYQDKMNEMGSARFFDDKGEWDGSWNDFSRVLGAQGPQMIASMATFGLFVGFQEASGAAMEIAQGKAAKRLGLSQKAFNSLPKDKQSAAIYEVVENGEADLDVAIEIGVTSAALDTASNFITFGGAKLLPKKIARDFVKKSLKRSLSPTAGKVIAGAEVGLESGARVVAAAATGAAAEVPTEIAQEVQKGARIKATLDNRKSVNFSEYLAFAEANPELIKETAIQAAMVPGPVQLAGVTVKEGYKGVVKNIASMNPDSAQSILNDTRKELKSKYQEDKNSIYENKSLTQKEKEAAILELNDNFDETWEATETAKRIINDTKLRTLSPERKRKVFDKVSILSVEQKKLNKLNEKAKKEPNNIDAALESDEQKKVVKKAGDSVLKERALDIMEKHGSNLASWVNSQKEGLFADKKVTTFQTTEEARVYIEKNLPNIINDKEVKALLEGKNNAIKSGNEAIIVKDTVEKGLDSGDLTGANSIHHEIAHFMLDSMSDADLDTFVGSIKDGLFNQSGQYKAALKFAEARQAQYAKDGYTNRQLNEEFLTAISDGLQGLRISDLSLDKAKKLKTIANSLKNLFVKNTDESLDFTDVNATNVMQFLKKYNNFNSDQKIITKEDVVSKDKPSVASKAFEEVSFEEGSINNAFKEFTHDGKKNNAPESFQVTAAYAYEPLAQAVVDKISKVGIGQSEEQDQFIIDYLASSEAKEAIVSDLIFGTDKNKASSLLGLAKTFNPKVGSFGGYAKGFLGNRAIRVLQERVGQQATVGAQALDAPESKEIAADAVDTTETDSRSTIEKLNVPNAVDKVNKLSELSIVKADNALAGKDFTTAKKIAARDKAFYEIFSKQLFNDIKTIVGKNTKNSEDFTKFINNNFDLLSQVAVENINFQKGGGPSSTWNKMPPTKEEFIAYYEATGEKASTKADRKKSLNNAIARQIANEARVKYAEENTDEADRFAEESGIVLASKTVTEKDTGKKVPLQDVLLDVLAEGDNNPNIIKPYSETKKEIEQYLYNKFQEPVKVAGAAAEYYTRKSIMILYPELKPTSDKLKVSDATGGLDLEFVNTNTGEKIQVEVKESNTDQMGGAGISFDLKTGEFSRKEKMPENIFNIVKPELEALKPAIVEYLEFTNQNSLNISNLPREIRDQAKEKGLLKAINKKIDMPNVNPITQSYSDKGSGSKFIYFAKQNKLYSLSENNKQAPMLAGKSKLEGRLGYSGDKNGKSSGTYRVQFRLDPKTLNEGIKLTSGVLASKTINEDFNKMLERVKGVKAEARYSEDRANKLAGNKGKFKFFVPYSAEDFVGLIYPTLGKGKEGDRNLQWYKETLLDPFAVGISKFEKAKQATMNDWAELKKRIKNTPAGLKKEAVRGFTNEEAVRVYLWNENNVVPNTLAKKDVTALVKHVNDNKVLKNFAEGVKAVLGGKYPDPQGDWLAGTLTTDLINDVNTVARKDFLQQWQENVDIVYSKENMNKLKAIYGERYTEALDNILHRMKTGRNRPGNKTRLENSWMDWVNDSVGTVMFFNTRSALLQTISSINFLNWSDNNPLMAGKAFANQPQFWKDFAFLFNSDFLKQRRSGLTTDVNADEIANAAATSTNKVKAAMSALLKAGFLPTQMADSFAIGIGGAGFYRNRFNTYKKQGMSDSDAQAQAMLDFQEAAEESQQSSRPDRVSMQQAGSLGRVILAFANTPMQYARLTKKATLDLANGRGDWKTNISKILYYGAVQNIAFTALQQAMFAMLFDDDTEDKEKEASAKIVNGIVDTFLRGSGVGGVAVATMKNIVMEAIKQQKSKRPDYTKAALKATTLSPPIDTKLRKLMSAGRSFTYRQSLEDMRSMGIDVDNPAGLAVGQVISATTNVPLDRVIIKARNLKGAMDMDNETWQQIALAMGYSEWQLGIEKDKSNSLTEPRLKKQQSFKRPGLKKLPKLKKSPNKRLENGIAGRANNDGTIEIDPNLSPIEREKTIAHEEKHMKDMESGKLAYDDDNVTWNGKKYKRKNGKIMYNGKALIEGDPSLPWEKVAYAAEPSESAIKRRLY